jgi:trans-aconitate methyltransferase
MNSGYYHTKESVEEYIRLAKDVNGKQLIEKLKQVLPAKSFLLELGSGPGSDWKILNETYNVTGSDNSTEFINHLKSEIYDGQFIELDAITLETEMKFDGIYSNKVLHHLRDHELTDSIRRQYEILNPDGMICHSFWKGEGSEIFKGLFVNYHSETDLKEMHKDHFEILSIESYEEFEEGDSLLLIGRKK